MSTAAERVEEHAMSEAPAHSTRIASADTVSIASARVSPAMIAPRMARKATSIAGEAHVMRVASARNAITTATAYRIIARMQARAKRRPARMGQRMAMRQTATVEAPTVTHAQKACAAMWIQIASPDAAPLASAKAKPDLPSQHQKHHRKRQKNPSAGRGSSSHGDLSSLDLRSSAADLAILHTQREEHRRLRPPLAFRQRAYRGKECRSHHG